MGNAQSGDLSKAEAKTYKLMSKMSMEPKELKKLFDSVDLDKSGELDREETYQFLQLFFNVAYESAAKQLSRADLYGVKNQKLKDFRDHQNAHREEIFTFIDFDKSGKVSFAEFEQFLKLSNNPKRQYEYCLEVGIWDMCLEKGYQNVENMSALFFKYNPTSEKALLFREKHQLSPPKKKQCSMCDSVYLLSVSTCASCGSTEFVEK
jgi:Ca2+-binding EF-hand superfamily protein